MSGRNDAAHGDEAFMSVADLKSYVERVETAKAAQAHEAIEEVARARHDLIEKLMEPIELTHEKLETFKSRLRDAALRGEHELIVIRFPSQMCKDHGRAVNLPEDDWPDTLVGAPRQIYDFWKEHLQPLGYGLKAMIIDWPNGFPGDVGMFVTWK
ncbi:hypothetical protein [Methylocella sp.]|uniref:hypothetical protein n=1 Tax=Methylocella sp. TaxID=1978226 RepID=UPI0037839083